MSMKWLIPETVQLYLDMGVVVVVVVGLRLPTWINQVIASCMVVRPFIKYNV